MAEIVEAVDRFQRRTPVIGVPLGVIYKYVDDQGGYLAAILAYYGFIAIFPLLLLASSILGLLLQGNPQLQAEVLNSALSQFPVIGDELGRPAGLQGSITAVVVGAVTAIYGSLGLGQAIQNAVNVAWSVPRNSRPNPFLARLKSLGLIGSAGLAILGLSVVSALGASTEVFGINNNTVLTWLIRLVTVLLVGGVLAVLMSLAAAGTHSVVRSAPGAFVLALMFQLLQTIGAAYATHVLTETRNSNVNQTFGLVLGLIGIIYIGAVMSVIGIEVNVVLYRRLWPRALLTPFTDNVDLTDADRRAYAAYARAQRHKGFENVEVTWDRLPVIHDEPTAPTQRIPTSRPGSSKSGDHRP